MGRREDGSRQARDLAWFLLHSAVAPPVVRDEQGRTQSLDAAHADGEWPVVAAQRKLVEIRRKRRTPYSVADVEAGVVDLDTLPLKERRLIKRQQKWETELDRRSRELISVAQADMRNDVRRQRFMDHHDDVVAHLDRQLAAGASLESVVATVFSKPTWSIPTRDGDVTFAVCQDRMARAIGPMQAMTTEVRAEVATDLARFEKDHLSPGERDANRDHGWPRMPNSGKVIEERVALRFEELDVPDLYVHEPHDRVRGTKVLSMPPGLASRVTLLQYIRPVTHAHRADFRLRTPQALRPYFPVGMIFDVCAGTESSIRMHRGKLPDTFEPLQLVPYRSMAPVVHGAAQDVDRSRVSTKRSSKSVAVDVMARTMAFDLNAAPVEPVVTSPAYGVAVTMTRGLERDL